MKRLEDLATECTRIAHELLAELEPLRLPKGAARSKTILSALRTAWTANKIEGIKSRLQAMRDELQFRILVSIRSDQLQGLDGASQRAIQSVVETNKELSKTITSQTENILQRQDADGCLASTRHAEVLQAINQQKIEKYSIQDVTREIVNSLHSPRQDDRYEDIVPAHQKTFDWALEDSTKDSKSWPSLVDWLRRDGGVYWISGKAASGKSTLMKFLFRDPRFMEALRIWASDDRLIVAHYYFWSSGAEIQRSQEGLLRSLLWQVLHQNTSMASVLFAEQFLPHAEWEEFPTFHQLRRAFGRLTSQSLSSTKIAIVVDGLDEFDAQRLTMTELGELLINATEGGHTKALLSSRPLTAFIDCFDGRPQLKLQQLTHNDITTYVYDRLIINHQMSHLKATYKSETQALVEEIVSSASGVFLWVKVVVESLLEGLQDGDLIEDLRLRLRSLPKDLEALFAHMLGKVPSSYKPQAARIFQILRCNEEGHKQAILKPWEQLGSLSALRLSYAEARVDQAIRAEICPLSNEELEQREFTTERRLRSRCAGLLELRTREHAQLEGTNDASRASRGVVYLHKTVADFLSKEEVWNEITCHTEGLEFSASRAVLQALIMEIKKVNISQRWAEGRRLRMKLVGDALLLARKTEVETQTSSRELLDELERIMTSDFAQRIEGWDSGHYNGASWGDTQEEVTGRSTPSYDNFMSLAVRFGLTLYVRDTIREKGPSCLTKRGRPLLDYALDAERLDIWRAYRDPELVQTLLLNGANPNDKFNGYSVWQKCLSMDDANPIKWISTLRAMLLHGADANARIETIRNRPETGYDIIHRSFDGLLNGDVQITRKIAEVIQVYTEQLLTEAVLADTLAQLKLDIVELKALLIKRGARGSKNGAEESRDVAIDGSEGDVGGKEEAVDRKEDGKGSEVSDKVSNPRGKRVTLFFKRLLGGEHRP